jgi:hypothetical protein
VATKRPSSDRAPRDATRRGHTFATVEALGRALPDVEVTTAGGQVALKVRGKLFACTATHKSAEPNSLMVRMDFAARDALVEEDPDTYYLKEHYVPYPCVLVRLNRVHLDALRDLVAGAHRFVGTPKHKAGRRRDRRSG